MSIEMPGEASCPTPRATVPPHVHAHAPGEGEGGGEPASPNSSQPGFRKVGAGPSGC